MSDYEKQLEEANQNLREQLEKETARADMLEKKLKDSEPKGALKEVKKYQAKMLKDMYMEINKDTLSNYPKFIFSNKK
jgi:hypothetical protein